MDGPLRDQWLGSRAAFAAGVAAVALCAVSLLSIGLTRDWELLHDDNGAMHTTFALSHLRLGLGRTRAHDLYFEPRSGAASRYGHHPPGPALALAAVFAASGSDTPAVARVVPIAFQLGSLLLMIRLLTRLLPRGAALLGGALMAALPMGAYFGRMVNYEPLCLFAVMLELTGYVALKQGESRRGLPTLVLGVVLGGLIDWPSLFFAAVIGVALAADDLTSRPLRVLPVAVVALSAGGILFFDIAHLLYAGGGSLRSLGAVAFRPSPAGWGSYDAPTFVLTQLKIAQRYYTDAGLLSSLLIAGALLVPRWRLGARLLDADDAGLLRRLLVIAGGAAAAYVLAAPSWALVHAYWQFYALPYVVVSMLLVARLLWRAGTEDGRRLATALLVLFAVDTAIGSASTLYFRHTHPSVHAERQTAQMRATYLAPAHLDSGAAAK